MSGTGAQNFKQQTFQMLMK